MDNMIDNERHFDLSNPNPVKPKTTQKPQGQSAEPIENVNRRRYLLTGTTYKSVVEQQIEEARERGDFDDLPSKGKPLELGENPYAGDMELAYKILKDNNFTLPWIATRNDLIEEIELFRKKLERQWLYFGPQILAMARGGQEDSAKRRWAALLSQWETASEALNKRILDLNVVLPVRKLQIVALRLDVELTRIGTSIDAIEHAIQSSSHLQNR